LIDYNLSEKAGHIFKIQPLVELDSPKRFDSLINLKLRDKEEIKED